MSKKNLIPVAATRVQAGFPSPADDFAEAHIDLTELLIDHPAATFLVQVQGDSMEGAGIYEGDTVLVDRARVARSGSIVIAVVDGHLTIKRLQQRAHRWFLVAEHPDYPALALDSFDEAVIWGVVTTVIRRMI